MEIGGGEPDRRRPRRVLDERGECTVKVHVRNETVRRGVAPIGEQSKQCTVRQRG